MNQIIQRRPAVRSIQWSKRLLWILLLAPCFLLTGCLRISSDASALRDEVFAASGAQWNEKIEIAAGPISCAMARFGLRWVELDKDAREGVGALCSGEVGVYERKGRHSKWSNFEVLAKTDAAMSKRACERLVAVTDDHQMVAIYVPKEALSGARVRVILCVLQDRQLVCASAKADLEPLLNLAMQHANPGGKFNRALIEP